MFSVISSVLVARKFHGTSGVLVRFVTTQRKNMVPIATLERKHPSFPHPLSAVFSPSQPPTRYDRMISSYLSMLVPPPRCAESGCLVFFSSRVGLRCMMRTSYPLEVECNFKTNTHEWSVFAVERSKKKASTHGNSNDGVRRGIGKWVRWIMKEKKTCDRVM